MKQVSEKDITEAINQLDPENHVEEKEDISGQNNRVFRIKLAERTVICKFCTGENSIQDCRKEVKMHQLLKNQTSANTPEILYSNPSTERTEFPFFIAEYVEGESLQDSFTELTAEKQVEIIEQAGQILGEVHSKISFQYSGELIPENSNISVNRRTTWIKYITQELTGAVEKAEDTRFSDLTEKAENLVEVLSELEEPERTLVFYDFRPDNVIAESGRIKALVDFERALSGDPLWDYAYSEMSFVEPHQYYSMHDPPNAGEEKLRKAFQRGYKKQTGLKEDWCQNIKLYKLGIIIKRFNSFKDWTEGAEMAEEEIRRQEKLLRNNFDKLYQSLDMR